MAQEPIFDDTGDAQAVGRRISPWMILGAILVVLAVILGMRGIRKSRAKNLDKDRSGDSLPDSDDPGAGDSREPS